MAYTDINSEDRLVQAIFGLAGTLGDDRLHQPRPGRTLAKEVISVKECNKEGNVPQE